MVSLNTPLCDFGWKAVDFHLQGVDDTYWTLEKSKGENGLLVMFICNHCPYVKAILPRLVHDVRALKDLGIETIAIQSNDPLNYPEDSFENMKRIAHEFHFSFPYVIDETQEIAKAYNAICTPDFFGFNRNLALQYRGRFDATGRGDPPPDNTRDLYEAMKLIAETQSGPIEQKSSIGCSINGENEKHLHQIIKGQKDPIRLAEKGYLSNNLGKNNINFLTLHLVRKYLKNICHAVNFGRQ